MGIMNLLKANWTGKVGQTVGSKWKDKSTIRSRTKPSNPNTPAQQRTRTGFKELGSFLALFTGDLKGLSALNIKGMSIRNAIMSLNHEMIAAGQMDSTLIEISRGGLPKPGLLQTTIAAGLASATCTWTPSTAANISAKAKMVVVMASTAGNIGFVGSALQSAGTLSIDGAFPASTAFDVYWYLLDYRGSSKVGSPNNHGTVTSPAS